MALPEVPDASQRNAGDADAVMRCSEWSRLQQVNPAGTAGSYSGFLLVDWPLPWPRDVSEIAQLGAVAAMARESSVRVQAVVPQPEQPLRVAFYRWEASKGAYAGLEAPASAGSAATAETFLGGSVPAGAAPIEVTDVLVCGHGRRDRCCGSLGTALEVELKATGRLDGRYRVRRTSHTGGHRFAPTAVVLGEGTCWGYLDVDILIAVLEKSGSPSDVAGCYRGAPGLDSPQAQALEAALLEKVGWELLGWPRRGVLLTDGRVRFEATPPAGPRRVWEARVVPGRTLTPPPCGAPRSGSEKSDRELAVVELAEVD